MTSICKWSSLFILVLLAILPPRTTAAPTEAEVTVTDNIKNLCDMYNKQVCEIGDVQKAIDELHEAARAAIAAGSGGQECLRAECSFGTLEETAERMLLKETVEMYGNGTWPNVQPAKERAAELCSTIVACKILNKRGGLENLEGLLEGSKASASVGLYAAASEKILKEFHEAALAVTLEMAKGTDESVKDLSFDNKKTDMIGVLNGLLEGATQAAFSDNDVVDADELITDMIYVGGVKETTEMFKRIAVAMSLSANKGVSVLISQLRKNIEDRNLPKFKKFHTSWGGAVMKKKIAGLMANNVEQYVSNCIGWWMTKRAWHEIKTPRDKTEDGAKHERTQVYDDFTQDLVMALLDAKLLKEAEYDEFVRDAFVEALPRCVANGKTIANVGKFGLMVEIRTEMQENIKRRVLAYMKTHGFESKTLTEMGTARADNLAVVVAQLKAWNIYGINKESEPLPPLPKEAEKEGNDLSEESSSDASDT
eukprot:GHVS01009158.1.p1 GENE.GHVS01009158.1~~GHVS01009158.1.p1  ORF type:complete len:482 (-),score=64.41 GHVS01009158.1:423-1868(-)